MEDDVCLLIMDTASKHLPNRKNLDKIVKEGRIKIQNEILLKPGNIITLKDCGPWYLENNKNTKYLEIEKKKNLLKIKRIYTESEEEIITEGIIFLKADGLFFKINDICCICVILEFLINEEIYQCKYEQKVDKKEILSEDAISFLIEKVNKNIKEVFIIKNGK